MYNALNSTAFLIAHLLHNNKKKIYSAQIKCNRLHIAIWDCAKGERFLFFNCGGLTPTTVTYCGCAIRV